MYLHLSLTQVWIPNPSSTFELSIGVSWTWVLLQTVAKINDALLSTLFYSLPLTVFFSCEGDTSCDRTNYRGLKARLEHRSNCHLAQMSRREGWGSMFWMCCYITVDSGTTALQNGACTYRCISKQMHYKTPVPLTSACSTCQREKV
jgi:hypothetical protein